MKGFNYLGINKLKKQRSLSKHEYRQVIPIQSKESEKKKSKILQRLLSSNQKEKSEKKEKKELSSLEDSNKDEEKIDRPKNNLLYQLLLGNRINRMKKKKTFSTINQSSLSNYTGLPGIKKLHNLTDDRIRALIENEEYNIFNNEKSNGIPLQNNLIKKYNKFLLKSDNLDKGRNNSNLLSKKSFLLKKNQNQNQMKGVINKMPEKKLILNKAIKSFMSNYINSFDTISLSENKIPNILPVHKTKYKIIKQNLIKNENETENEQKETIKINEKLNHRLKRNQERGNFNKNFLAVVNQSVPSRNDNDLNAINVGSSQLERVSSSKPIYNSVISEKNVNEKEKEIKNSCLKEINKAYENFLKKMKTMKRSSMVDRLIFKIQSPDQCFEEFADNEKPGDKYQFFKTQINKERNKIDKLIMQVNLMQNKNDDYLKKKSLYNIIRQNNFK